jgi:CheY-like chemotaxis protein
LTDAVVERAGAIDTVRLTGRFVRTVIVSDSPDFIRAASGWIESAPGFIFVATADSGLAAVIVVNVLRPDLVLMDAEMAAMDGDEATRRIKAFHEPPTIVLITPHDPADIARAASDAGADAVISNRELGGSADSILRALGARPERPTDGGSARRVDR